MDLINLVQPVEQATLIEHTTHIEHATNIPRKQTISSKQHIEQVIIKTVEQDGKAAINKAIT